MWFGWGVPGASNISGELTLYRHAVIAPIQVRATFDCIPPGVLCPMRYAAFLLNPGTQ